MPDFISLYVRRRHCALWKAFHMFKIIGGIVFVLGAVLWLGNVFRFFPTFPLAGYLTMLVGGWLFKKGAAS